MTKDDTIKRKLIEEGWARPDGIKIFIDSLRDGVGVPLNVAREHGHELAIRLSQKSTVDISFEDFGIATKLSFSGKNHWCVFPWKSIWGLLEGSSLRVFHKSIPKKASGKILALVAQSKAIEKQEAKKEKKRKLFKVIK